MYRYAAYGMSLNSQLALPELPPASSRDDDVTIRLGRIDPWWSSAEGASEHLWAAPDEARLAWDQVGAFLVQHGREIIVDPLPGADERLVRLPLLGAVLATLLIQRGQFVLHASAVAIGRSAVIFLGGKGWGKSTLAATFCARGHRLLADDVVALELDEGEVPLVLPGFPQLKLWPDAATAALGDDPAALPVLVPGYEKRARAATEEFFSEALPVRGIYLLAHGPSPVVRALNPGEGVVQLIGHSYAARFGDQWLRGAEAARHFRACARILRTVPARALERPRDLALLPAAVDLVIQHVEAAT
ncbi:MAG TPA: hypothetical protein VFZ25_17190 [Chloroflexota bacterium]|nr:hypothetical protein [Chloroflexota bacterium]